MSKLDCLSEVELEKWDNQSDEDGSGAGPAAEESSGVRVAPSPLPSTPLAADPGLAADVYGITDVGCVRTSNQDQFLIAELGRTLTVQSSSAKHRSSEDPPVPQGRLMVVADGMGGYRGGEVASAVAVETFAGYVTAIAPWLVTSAPSLHEPLAEALRAAVTSADAAVHQMAVELMLDERMGSTLTAAYITWPEAFIVHVGDSRAYLVRDERLIRLTSDHTVAEELVAQHAMSKEQARGSHLRHVLVNAVGGVRGKRLVTDVSLVELEIGDTLLLCSDGLTAHVGEEELGPLLSHRGSAQERAEELIALTKSRGGYDNVTTVVARF